MTGKRGLKKLKSRAGESIAETLVALLISALALLMLAGAVSSAARVVTGSSNKLKEYYAADRNLATRSGADTNKVDITIAAEKVTQTFRDVNYYENETLGSTNVVAYAMPGD